MKLLIFLFLIISDVQRFSNGANSRLATCLDICREIMFNDKCYDL